MGTGPKAGLGGSGRVPAPCPMGVGIRRVKELHAEGHFRAEGGRAGSLMPTEPPRSGLGPQRELGKCKTPLPHSSPAAARVWTQASQTSP